MTKHFIGSTVKKGDLLYSFDAKEEQLELAKAEAALALTNFMGAKMAAVSGGGALNGVLDAARARIEENRQAYAELLAFREDQAKVGQVGSVTLHQAMALDSTSAKDLAVATLSAADLRTTADDLANVIPLQKRYCELTVQISQNAVDQLRLTSPKNGVLRWCYESSGWVARGAIIASFEED